ncbi:uncharacterized protein [Zea mays]|uniref:Uncharacterized protein n=1 Tax=Zea mays TaxID=4577 RepID=A0A804M2U6_MAIZE|nr:uncharacterized protein LOC103643898 isoform X1 [Zea mays]
MRSHIMDHAVTLEQCDSCHMGWGSYVIVPAGCCFSHYSTDILKCAADAVSCLLFLGFRRRENSFRLPEDRREMFELLLHRLRTKSIMEAMDALPSIFGACRLKNRPHCKSTSMSLVF